MNKLFAITHVSTSDLGGGAERLAASIHRGCLDAGLDSTLAVGRKQSGDPTVCQIPNDANRGAWFHAMNAVAQRASAVEQHLPGVWRLRQLAQSASRPSQWRDEHAGREHFDYPGTAEIPLLSKHAPDLIHCHNLHGSYFDLRELAEISQHTPTAITLHDAWLLAGHCAHSLDCDRWERGCGSCPQLQLPPTIKRDATARNWRVKEDIFARSQLHIITPSRWLMRKVELSMLAPGIISSQVIPNGVDLTTFRPGDRNKARAAFGIDPAAHVVVFAAANLRRSAWKDYQTLHAAFEKLTLHTDARPLVLLAVGDSAPSERLGRAEIRFIPFNTNPSHMATLYRAADVYAHAAKADTFPTAVIEAMACGVPVVASDVGGIPEQVDHGVTGFLVPRGDASAMAERIGWLLRDDTFRRRLSTNAARTARARYDMHRMMKDHLDLYGRITQTSVTPEYHTRSAA